MLKRMVSIAEGYPDIAAMWHPEKNDGVTPDQVAFNCRDKYWMLLPYDDPETGKHFDFEWKAAPRDLTERGVGCPFLTGNAVWPGYNDLESLFPEIAAEWDYEKNFPLTPDKIAAKSNAKVWWKITYHDPDLNRDFVLSWDDAVKNRTVRGVSCPYLTNYRVLTGFNDLAFRDPEIASQWHPVLNGDLSPEKVVWKSNKTYWWYAPYDDPKTGKHYEFEWQETVNERRSRRECPFVAGYRLWPGFNDFASRYPRIAKQWHPFKNDGRRPEDFLPFSQHKAWWLLRYDDPVTGRRFDFEWRTTIASRTSGDSGCPYLSGGRLLKGFNDLKTRNPELAAQWHPTKNGKLKPDDVMPLSRGSFWWLLPYDDPVTGKHFDFEWKASLRDRRNGEGCPFLSNKKVWPGFNDLATTHPDLAAQWHPKKNGRLRPDMVTRGSSEMVWWFLPYDDPFTGKHFDFEWPATVTSRTSKDLGCPFLSGRALWPGFNDFATKHPRLAKQWHPTKNGSLTPDQVFSSDKRAVWWRMKYYDSYTGKTFEFEWEAGISGRVDQKHGCPFLSNRALWRGFNDLQTRYPDLAAQWHPTKNGTLTPADVFPHSTETVWWFLPYDEPETGRHFDFEWQAKVISRFANGSECPYLTGNLVWPGFNDLATKNPELAKEWHPTKNRGLTPDKVATGDKRKYWWFMPYDDPETGRHFDFEWQASVTNRNNGAGCPFLCGVAVWPGFNDLATKNPELAKQWHPTKNGGLTPADVTTGSNENVWWLLPYDDPITGKHFDFEWQAVIAKRNDGTGCPFLTGYAVWPGFNDLATRNPELAKQWHPTKNMGLTPDKVLAGGEQWAWWILPYDDPETGKHFDFEWMAQVNVRLAGGGECPYFSNRAVWPGYNDLASYAPEIAAEWHPTKNGSRTPEKTMKFSQDYAWWLCRNGHEWYASVIGRTKYGAGCRECMRIRRRNGYWDD